MENERNIKEEEEIKKTLEKYILLYNSNCFDKKISFDNIFINNCVNKPGAIGCYLKNSKWFIYQVDDRFNFLVNGPFSRNGVIVALANMLYISSNVIDYNFTEDEYRLFLQGVRPTGTFGKK